jgi:hypothetical protein
MLIPGSSPSKVVKLACLTPIVTPAAVSPMALQMQSTWYKERHAKGCKLIRLNPDSAYKTR